MCPVPNRKPLTAWTVPLVLLTMAAGLLITAWVTYRFHASEQQLAEEQFRRQADVLRLNTEREIQLFAEVLNSIRALHGLSGEISADTFEEFVNLGMIHQRQILGTFGFAQRIGHAVRQSIEQAYEESPAFGYRIVERSAETGDFVPAALRPVYYPLTWESSPRGLGVPIGYDFISQAAASHALQQMQVLGGPALVGTPIPAPAAETESYWVFSPIFHAVNREPAPVARIMIGFALGRIEPTSLLQRVAGTALLSPAVELELVRRVDSGEQVERLRNHWVYRHPIDFFDQTWHLICRMPVAPAGRSARTAMIAGLMITLLVTSQLALIASRTRQIENEVRDRTRDLREAKEQLEVQMQERMRLEEEMSDLAMRERQRLGRDLHDSLGQKLTGAVMLSRAMVRHFKDSGLPQEAHAKTLNDTLKESVGQVRAMARGLAPVTLNDESIPAALEHLAAEMTSLYGVSCEWMGTPDIPDLPGKTKEQLYLIAREATNNAARHAQAGRIRIDLRHAPGEGLVLQVEDDGCGIPDAATRKTGMGLRIMQHRARMMQAELTIAPGLHRGTVVRLRADILSAKT